MSSPLSRGAIAGLVLAVALGASLSTADTARAEENAEQLMREAHLNLYYTGDDGRAVVDMTLTDKRGKTRTRKFVMLRKDIEDGGEQKYYTYFLEPSDVRRTGFMVWKSPDAEDSRWIYVPAVDLVKRISAKDKGSSFVGSDFSYEDVSGRHWSEDDHTLLREEELDGRATWVVESVPRESDSFARKLTWIAQDVKFALREEYYDKKDRLLRVFQAERIEELDGHLTVTVRSMTNEKKGRKTVVEFGDIDYDLGIEDAIFTERYLKNPPADLVSE